MIIIIWDGMIFVSVLVIVVTFLFTWIEESGDVAKFFYLQQFARKKIGHQLSSALAMIDKAIVFL